MLRLALRRGRIGLPRCEGLDDEHCRTPKSGPHEDGMKRWLGLIGCGAQPLRVRPAVAREPAPDFSATGIGESFRVTDAMKAAGQERAKEKENESSGMSVTYCGACCPCIGSSYNGS